jgi:hypothetical protein
MILCALVSSFGIYVHLVQMATPNFTHIRIKLILFAHSNLVESLKLVAVVFACDSLSSLRESILVHMLASSSDICHLF